MQTNRALRKKVLFLNLTTFSQTGGIEKFNRCFLKALVELEDNNRNVYSNSHSLYDNTANHKYYPVEKYSAFGKNRVRFVLQSIRKAKRFDCIVLGHINLAIIGCILKLLFPKKEIILITHGIEVWAKLPVLQRMLLHRASKILSVSNFTKRKLLDIERIDDGAISIFPNTIDPFFNIPNDFMQSTSMRSRLGIAETDFVLFTLTRLSSKEKYKGYDIVIECLPDLLKQNKNLKYIIAGKYDSDEKQRLDRLINDLKLKDVVIITGFVEEDELVSYYQMSDVYIMPSKKEGFGIVFIEAMVCGLPVIGGNVDGSVDALRNGELGILVNPNDKNEITHAIVKMMKANNKLDMTHFELQQKTLEYFGFPKFKERLKNELVSI